MSFRGGRAKVEGALSASIGRSGKVKRAQHSQQLLP
jgi:hypothetical protein